MQWVQQGVTKESANVPWFISVRLVGWSVILQLLLKVYSLNRVTDVNNFSVMSVVSEVFDHCCVHFVGLSEGLMLPHNQQSSTEGPRPARVLFPVTIPTPDSGAAIVWVLSSSPHPQLVSLLQGCGAGLSACLGWSSQTAQPGAQAGVKQLAVIIK